MKQLLTIILITLTLTLCAQEKCGTQEYIMYMEKNNPEYKIARENVNSETKNWIQSNYNKNSKLYYLKYEESFYLNSEVGHLEFIVKNKDNVIPHEKRIGDKLLTSYFVKPCDGFVTLSRSKL